MIFTDVRQLAAEIRNNFGREALIGVDGWTGVGKTTLAEALAESAQGEWYDIDDALIRIKIASFRLFNLAISASD